MPTRDFNTPRGRVRISSPEATAFDLVGRPERSGGLDHVITVLAELAEELQSQPLASPVHPCRRFPGRSGWVTSWIFSASPKKRAASPRFVEREAHETVPLAPGGEAAGTRNARWQVQVNSEVVSDDPAIPLDFIAAWRAWAPWIQSAQVEQDLVLSRALVEIFDRPELSEKLAFRGGTALNKLFLEPAVRYSEDIDLVQLAWTDRTGFRQLAPMPRALDRSTQANPGGGTGHPDLSVPDGRSAPLAPATQDQDQHSRALYTVLGLETRTRRVESPWFRGSAEIPTYSLAELLGTKLRALFQRKKGRDLFDLWWVGRHAPFDPQAVVHCFERYLAKEDRRVSRAEFEANLIGKLSDPAFLPLTSDHCYPSGFLGTAIKLPNS